MAVCIDVIKVEETDRTVVYRYMPMRGSANPVEGRIVFDRGSGEVVEVRVCEGDGSQFFASRAARAVSLRRRDSGDWPERTMWAS